METMKSAMIPDAIGTAPQEASRLPNRSLWRRLSLLTGWAGRRESPSDAQAQRGGGGMAGQARGNPWFISAFVLVVFLLAWHFFTLRSTFDQRGLTADQLQLMEFNGDIVQSQDGSYIWNPEKEKLSGIPGPLAVLEKAKTELSEAFVKKGTNDHGIGYLVFYTVSRFAGGFLAASIIAIMIGVMLGLNKVLFRAANPFIQILKPISPLAWMPLLLYTVKDPEVDRRPRRFHGRDLAHAGDDRVRGQFTEKRVFARGGHHATILVQAADQGDSSRCRADDRERIAHFVRQRAGRGRTGGDAAWGARCGLSELD